MQTCTCTSSYFMVVPPKKVNYFQNSYECMHMIWNVIRDIFAVYNSVVTISNECVTIPSISFTHSFFSFHVATTATKIHCAHIALLLFYIILYHQSESCSNQHIRYITTVFKTLSLHTCLFHLYIFIIKFVYIP